MLNIVYALAGVVLVIFHYCMLQKSNLIDTIIQYDVGGCVICISNKVEYLDNEGRYINFTKDVV